MFPAPPVELCSSDDEYVINQRSLEEEKNSISSEESEEEGPEVSLNDMGFDMRPFEEMLDFDFIPLPDDLDEDP